MTTLSPFTQKKIKEFFRLQKIGYFEHSENPDRLSIINKKIEKKLKNKEKDVFKIALIKKVCTEFIATPREKNSSLDLINLLLERCGYKNNGDYSKTKRLQDAIEEYLFFYNEHGKGLSTQLLKKTLSLLSLRIKYCLDGYTQEYLLIKTISSYFHKLITTEDSRALIKVAVADVFFHPDKDFLVHLYAEESALYNQMNIYQYLQENESNIIKKLNSPSFIRMKYFCKTNNTPYLVLASLLQEKEERIGDILKSPQTAESKIKEKYQQIVSDTSKKINKITIEGILLIVVSSLMFFVSSIILLPPASNISLVHLNAILIAIAPVIAIIVLRLLSTLRKRQNEKLILIETLSILYKKEIDSATTIDEKKHEQAAVVIADTLYKILSAIILATTTTTLMLISLNPLTSLFLTAHLSFVIFVKIRIAEEVSVIYSTKIESGRGDVLAKIIALPFLIIRNNFTYIANSYWVIYLKIFFLNFPVASKILKEKLTKNIYEKKEKLYH